MAGIGWSLLIVPSAAGEFGGLARFSLRLVGLEDSAERDARQFTTHNRSSAAKMFRVQPLGYSLSQDATTESFDLSNGDQPCVKLRRIELP